MKNNLMELFLKQASSHYHTGMIEGYFDFKTGKEKKYDGDTLALFIGREIISVFDDTSDLEENECNVYNALSNAVEELSRVRDAFSGTENR